MSELFELTLTLGEPYDSGTNRAETHLHDGDYQTAITTYTDLLRTAEQTDTPQTRFIQAMLHTRLGMALAELTQLETAQHHATAAIALFSSGTKLELVPAGYPEDLDIEMVHQQVVLHETTRALFTLFDIHIAQGNHDSAEQLLVKANELVTQRYDDGTLIAEIVNNQATLAMNRGNWNLAERLTQSALNTTSPDSAIIPHLHTTLARICSATGRFDDALDHLTEAENHPTHNIDNAPHHQRDRAYIAFRQGQYDAARQLYQQAAHTFEKLGQDGELAVCEQVLGYIALLCDDPTGASELLTTSHTRFTKAGAHIHAAATQLLLAQQILHSNGDHTLAVNYTNQARAIFEQHQQWEKCAYADYLTTLYIEKQLDAGNYDDQKAALTQTLWIAIPMALALTAIKFQFDTGHARAQWSQLAQSATNLVFRLANRAKDASLMYELIEHHSAGTPLANHHQNPPTETELPPLDLTNTTRNPTEHNPHNATSLHTVPAGLTTGDGIQISPPPGILVSPGDTRIALKEFIELAETRYHVRVIGTERVTAWPPDTSSK